MALRPLKLFAEAGVLCNASAGPIFIGRVQPEIQAIAPISVWRITEEVLQIGRAAIVR